MIIYEYKCECGRLIDVEFPLGQAPAEIERYCPVCDARIIHKRFYTAAGLIFRGGGWGGHNSFSTARLGEPGEFDESERRRLEREHDRNS